MLKAFIASRKGLLVYKKTPGGLKLERTFFDGVKTSYVSVDPYTKNVWVGLNHGHWGPKLHVSTNKGKTFTEVSTPKFAEAKAGEKALTVKDIWAITADKSGRVYVGTDPAEIFTSDDLGKTWQLNQGLHHMEEKEKWMAGGTEGSCVHSILINPENQKHITIGISVAGVLESRDGGKKWQYKNNGLKANFLPDVNSQVGQDPHLVERALSNPDILWQQNHCGIFKSEDCGHSWQDFSSAKGVKSPFGWAVVIDDQDENTVYTIPALSDETRVPIQKKLLVQKTTNGGKSWTTLTSGLPQKNCYDIIYRHAFSGSKKNLLFGSTTGHVFYSSNSGKNWKQIKDFLPPIYAVKLVDF